jgi:hypothetical protein
MKIVHVYQQRIRSNIKAAPEEREPPIIIRDKKKRTYANEIEINGPCRIVYSPDEPLDCGALASGLPFPTTPRSRFFRDCFFLAMVICA